MTDPIAFELKASYEWLLGVRLPQRAATILDDAVRAARARPGGTDRRSISHWVKLFREARGLDRAARSLLREGQRDALLAALRSQPAELSQTLLAEYDRENPVLATSIHTLRLRATDAALDIARRLADPSLSPPLTPAEASEVDTWRNNISGLFPACDAETQAWLANSGEHLAMIELCRAHGSPDDFRRLYDVLMTRRPALEAIRGGNSQFFASAAARKQVLTQLPSPAPASANPKLALFDVIVSEHERALADARRKDPSGALAQHVDLAQQAAMQALLSQAMQLSFDAAKQTAANIRY